MPKYLFDLRAGKRVDLVQATSFTKTEEARLSEDLLNEYHAARAQWAEQAQEDLEFRNGVQWTKEEIDELRRRKQAPIVVNVIHPAVEQAKALLTAHSPRFTAVAREDSDTKMANIFANLMSYIWDVSNGNTQLKQAIDDYYVMGMGVLCVYFDPHLDFGKGEVCVKSIDPLDVYIDPNSKDLYCRDAAHILIAKLASAEQLQQVYPDILEIIQKGAVTKSVSSRPSMQGSPLEGQDVRPTENPMNVEQYEIIDRYSKVNIDYTHVIDMASGVEKVFLPDEYKLFLKQPAILKTVLTEDGPRKEYVTREQDIEPLLEIHRNTGGVFHFSRGLEGQPPILRPGAAEDDPEGLPGTTTIITILTMADMIDQGVLQKNVVPITRIKRVLTVGGIEAYVGVLPIDEYPVVPLMNRHNRNPYPISDVRFVRGIQEYINKLRSLIIAHATSSTNVKLLIPRGAVKKSAIEEEWARAGTGVIEYEAEIGAPVVVGPVPLPNELYKDEAQARADVEQIFGIYALMQGDPNQAPETFKGTVALDEYGQRRIKSKQDDIESFLNQVARVAIQLIQSYYTEYKLIRLLNPNKDVIEMQINQPLYDEFTGQIRQIVNDITVGKYDVIVVSGSTLPSNRWALFENYLRLYQLGVIDQIELLKKTEVADIEGVLARFSERARLLDRIAQLEQLVKNLQGDLQTAQREAVHSKMRTEVEKFKSDLQAESAKLGAASEVFKARLQDVMRNAQDVIKNAQEISSIPPADVFSETGLPSEEEFEEI